MTKSVNHPICAFLRRCIRQMKKLGLNQTQLAQRLHVSRPYVTKLFSGDVNISFGAAMRLARALDMDFMPELRERNAKNAPSASSTLLSLTSTSSSVGLKNTFD